MYRLNEYQKHMFKLKGKKTIHYYSHEKVREYNQEMLQSQTADQSTARLGRATGRLQ